MYRKVFPILAYFRYWLTKEEKHSLQSPAVFQIYTGLKSFVQGRKHQDLDLEDLRKEFLSSKSSVPVLDLGAGSKKVNGKTRPISEVTRYSTSSRKFNQLYQYFVNLTPAKRVLELGTCMGINTRYLNRICKGDVFTFEGSEDLLNVAFEREKPQNLHTILGDIAVTLPEFLKENTPIDFALIDANHTYEGTINSYNLISQHLQDSSIVAVADIYWSPEMQSAWEEIKSRKEVTLSLDFYECGILIFNYPGKKSHYVLSY